MKIITTRISLLLAAVALVGLAGLAGCTQESQNQLRRGIQNWTGNDGVLDILNGQNVQMRFIKIDKISTAYGTSDDVARSYRYGYGTVDENMNFIVDPGEEKVYFEFSDYSTNYIFYENYKN